MGVDPPDVVHVQAGKAGTSVSEARCRNARLANRLHCGVVLGCSRRFSIRPEAT